MKIQIAVATAAPKKFVPAKTVVKLVEAYPTMRDLASRLLKIPLLNRGHFVTGLPTTDDALIAYAEKNRFKMAYGYRIWFEAEKVKIDVRLFCLDENGKLLEDEKDRLTSTRFYAGVRIPDADIKSRRYALNFERMDYVMRNLE